MNEEFDVIIVGGGPTGTTTACLLAQEGVSVLVIEKDHYPRFHIGESLLPCDIPIFERLGIDPKDKGFLHKGGAYFVDERIGGSVYYSFADALPGTPDHAFQVERAVFDEWLLDHAKKLGVTVRQGDRVIEAQTPDRGGPEDHVVVKTTATHASERAEHPDRTYRARYLVDATGQDAIIGRADKTTSKIEDFGLGAVWSHYEELDPAIDHQLTVEEHGAIKIMYVDDGWCWAIPFGHGRISIGHVSRRRGINVQWLEDLIAASPRLSSYTKGAKRVRKPQVFASWSFYNKKQHGTRWTCTGDSACFLDPVFSSGVSLGMVGAAHVADTLIEALAKKDEGRADLMDAHTAHMMHAYNSFATLIHSWYHSELLHTLFFSPEPNLEWKRGLTSMIAGDMWRDDNKFQRMILANKRHRRELVPDFVNGKVVDGRFEATAP